MNILIVDNRDSFTHNLAHWVVQSSGDVPDIVRYDDFDYESLHAYDLMIISAGPGHPREYPAYTQVLLEAPIPILGICLGMQIMNVVLGGTVEPLNGCIHGQTDTVEFDNQVHQVARYHSLAVQKLGKGLQPLFYSSRGLLMGIKHCEKPVLGYQFHPESFLTENPTVFFEYAYRNLIADKQAAVAAGSCLA